MSCPVRANSASLKLRHHTARRATRGYPTSGPGQARRRRCADRPATEAIQIGGALGPLVADLKILTTRREHLLVRLNGGATERRAGIADLRALEAELRGYFAQWTELLRAHAQQARQMLRKLIDGRILVHPRDGEAVLEFRCTAGGVSCSKTGGGPNGIR